MTEEIKKIWAHAEQVAQRENCFLYDLEWIGKGSGRTLRVFIDKEGEHGVSIDDCSKVSRGLDLLLDVEDVIPGGSYQLEVSSPGLDRHLSKDWHYTKVIGKEVNIQLNQPLGELTPEVDEKEHKRKKMSGVIKSAGEKSFEIHLEPASDTSPIFLIPYSAVQKAKVVFNLEKNNKKQPKTRKG